MSAFLGLNERRGVLPDSAMTVYCAGGLIALRAYVAAGILAPGEYLCPLCDGGWRAHKKSKCAECIGTNLITFLVSGLWAATLIGGSGAAVGLLPPEATSVDEMRIMIGAQSGEDGLVRGVWWRPVSASESRAVRVYREGLDHG